jgi:hypothetical protein
MPKVIPEPKKVKSRLLILEPDLTVVAGFGNTFDLLRHVGREFESNAGVYYVACRGRVSKTMFRETTAVPNCVRCLAANLRVEWP